MGFKTNFREGCKEEKYAAHILIKKGHQTRQKKEQKSISNTKLSMKKLHKDLSQLKSGLVKSLKPDLHVDYKTDIGTKFLFCL